MSASQKQLDAAAYALCVEWSQQRPAKVEQAFNDHEEFWRRCSKACLEAAWKVWWEGVARSSGSTEYEADNNDT